MQEIAVIAIISYGFIDERNLQRNILHHFLLHSLTHTEMNADLKAATVALSSKDIESNTLYINIHIHDTIQLT